jgi:hypothetical protein
VVARPQWLTRVNQKLWNERLDRPLARQQPTPESAMLMEAFLLTPYLAMASSLVLTATVAAICCSQSAPRDAGFTA